MTKKSAYYDICVVGGGPAGLSLAAALAPHGQNICVIEQAAFPTHLAPEYDGRTTALTYQSQRVLQQAGVWQHLAASAQPIETIRVADQFTPHVLDFNSAELGLGPFGYIVENRLLRHALLTQLRRAKNVTLLAPASVRHADISGNMARLSLADNTTLQAALLVAADGKFSSLRAAQHIKTFDLTYTQTAFVCTVGHTLPHHNLALEHFLPQGPFAVLPMTNQRCGIVWTLAPAAAAALKDCSVADCLAAVQRAGAGYLGELSLIGQRFTYPLLLKHAASYTAPHFVLLGEAAHAMHPIAGQGFNMGLRDVECLAAEIAKAAALGLRADDASVLAAYESQRRADNQKMLAATDILDRLFSTERQPIAALRQLGLSVVNHTQPLRHYFMKEAMGA